MRARCSGKVKLVILDCLRAIFFLVSVGATFIWVLALASPHNVPTTTHIAWGSTTMISIAVLVLASAIKKRILTNAHTSNMTDLREPHANDFVAELTFPPATNGGPNTAHHSGYRPQLMFDFSPHQTSGRQIYLKKYTALPGESVTAMIKMASPNLFYGMLRAGQAFQFLEGDTLIGSGVVIEIFNPLLKSASS